jgi:hypothetical protein
MTSAKREQNRICRSAIYCITGRTEYILNINLRNSSATNSLAFCVHHEMLSLNRELNLSVISEYSHTVRKLPVW